jgi:hypothetical protein
LFPPKILGLRFYLDPESQDFEKVALFLNDMTTSTSPRKLTMEAAEEIRAAVRDGVKQIVLARRFGVHKGTICRVVKYLIYKPDSDLRFGGEAKATMGEDAD